jgi:hypothetical protein
MIHVLGLALAGAGALAIADAGSSGARNGGSTPAAEAPTIAVDDGFDDSPALPPGHPPIGDDVAAPEGAAGMPDDDVHGGSASPHGAPAAAPAPPQLGSIPRAEGATGKTVAEIVAQSAKLVDKTIRVRAKVTKRTDGVLGKTWLHVADGGGGDLVVTTTEGVELGAVVVLEGKITTDRDLGSGYRYAVLLEDARVVGKSP